MKGEHKGDFSRDTFDPSKHFLRVAMQQGRVSLDADWNEQVDILLHYMQTLARDIIGPFAGPAGEAQGFGITPTAVNSARSFDIGYGRYYVDGILCENEKKRFCGAQEVGPDQFIDYYHQQDYPLEGSEMNPVRLEEMQLPLLVYLDVWERHISYAEDDYIREKALGGPDTACRSKVVWQVKVLENSTNNPGKVKWHTNTSSDPTSIQVREKWPEIVRDILHPLPRGCLRARARKPEDETDPCLASPQAHFRGEENQLYRVEIHRGGEAAAATFKWSRDNGSVIFPILSVDGNTITLEHLGRDDKLSLKAGDWVEVIDDAYTLLVGSRPAPWPQSELWPRPLARVDGVDPSEMTVTLRLKDNYHLPPFDTIRDLHPLLRRWDHQEPDPARSDEPSLVDGGFAALKLVEGGCDMNDGWLTLEDGVQICFARPAAGQPANYYQAGDYWLIPARTATGDVEWPGNEGLLAALPPHGVDHHYAPLGILQDPGAIPLDCRCTIMEPTDCNLLAVRAPAKKRRSEKG